MLSKNSDWTEEDWINTHNKIRIDQSNDAVMQEVIETKNPSSFPDVYADDRPNHNVCLNFGIKGLYMFPLVSMGEVLGQISVVNLKEENFFIQMPRSSWLNQLLMGQLQPYPTSLEKQ